MGCLRWKEQVHEFSEPPRLAAWILQEFGPELNQEALAGDLNEAFQQGRSKGWYWRQVVAAIRWRRLIRPLLGSAAMAWLITSPTMNHAPIILSRTIDMAVITAAYFASIVAPDIKRRRFRVLLGLLIAATVGLLSYYKPDLAAYWMFLWILAANFVVERRARGPASHSLTELAYGNPDAERQRLMEKLHLTMLRETDPEVRRAYAESIAALRREQTPTAKATQ
jgi:hypothetical protein